MQRVCFAPKNNFCYQKIVYSIQKIIQFIRMKINLFSKKNKHFEKTQLFSRFQIKIYKFNQFFVQWEVSSLLCLIWSSLTSF